MEQNEIDALLKGIDATVEPEGEKTKSDDDLSWDDVQEELEQTRGASPKKTEVSSVNFQEVRKVETPKGNLDLEFILDIPLTLNVELGRCHMLINELLQLGHGDGGDPAPEQAQVLRHILHPCELPAVQGQDRACAPSLAGQAAGLLP